MNSADASAKSPSFESSSTPFVELRRRFARLQNRIHTAVDRTVTFPLQRWLFFAGLLVVFLIRVLIAQGWYIVTYALAIYLLNLFLLFLSPRIDPALSADAEFDADLDQDVLPTRSDDEFRPFIRRLPEFKFWRNGTIATCISLFMTLFSVFDIPVFWPILLLYFFVLLYMTMRRQIKHMITYKYLPFDANKKRYNSTS